MTSTSFNIGLTMGEKNSSRVLRPPGGGHSDIFGVRDNDNGMVTPSKKRNQPQSTIGSCFNMVEEETNENESQQRDIEITNGTNGEVVNGKNENEVDNGNDENTAPSDPKEELNKDNEEVQILGPKRVRVPPGGFSSGQFW